MSAPTYLDTLKMLGVDDMPELLEAHRLGGALIIARCMAIIDDPFATAQQIDSAASVEAMMRERHGDPKPGWLVRQVARCSARRAAHKSFMAQFVKGDDEPLAEAGWRPSEIRAVSYCMDHGHRPKPEKTRLTVSDVLRMRSKAVRS